MLTGRALRQLPALLQLGVLPVCQLLYRPAEGQRQAGGVGHSEAVALGDAGVGVLNRQPDVVCVGVVFGRRQQQRQQLTTEQHGVQEKLLLGDTQSHVTGHSLKSVACCNSASAHLYLLKATLGDETVTSTCTYS